MNNIVKIFMLIILGSIFTVVFATPADEIDDFMAKQRQILEQQHQENVKRDQQIQEQMQQSEAQAKQTQQELDKLNKAPATPVGSSTSQTPGTQQTPQKSWQAPAPASPVSSQAVESCNCYDARSPYNYPNNYLYDDHNQRTYQITPYCKCKPKQSSNVTAPVTRSAAPSSSAAQPGPDTTGGTQQNNESYFNIRY